MASSHALFSWPIAGDAAREGWEPVAAPLVPALLVTPSRLVPSRADEMLDHRLPHQRGRQQALRQHVIMKCLLVERAAHLGLDLVTQFIQPREAIEIAGRLAWRAEGVPLDLLRRHGV